MASARDQAEQIAHFAALQWHIDQGMDEVLGEAPGGLMTRLSDDPIVRKAENQPTAHPLIHSSSYPLQGTPELRQEAIRLASSATNLEELRAAIAAFTGIAIRKTATNLVFCDGNPQAPIMLVGEAPEADEDRTGKPFAGESGHLLDRILKYIDIDRAEADPEHALYVASILNWRPPGNRSPSAAELELSIPFIERHIALVKPKLLVLCGGGAAKALLNTNDGISKLRGRWHNYVPQTPGIESAPIPAIVTYEPAYLLKTPNQKRAVWQDMLMLAAKRQELGISAKAA